MFQMVVANCKKDCTNPKNNLIFYNYVCDHNFILHFYRNNLGLSVCCMISYPIFMNTLMNKFCKINYVFGFILLLVLGYLCICLCLYKRMCLFNT